MVAGSPALLDAAFHALSHPTRRTMLALLAQGERTVGELAAPFDVSLAASSKHLRVLEDAGFVRRRVEGRIHTCTLVTDPLQEVADWTERFRPLWEPAFQRLDALLEDLREERASPPSGPSGAPSEEPEP